eukprot:m.62706 g.62706  ORF g.62706 m.62706 type:complete len:1271 (+) comp8040_c2_seq2:177-3989(+)
MPGILSKLSSSRGLTVASVAILLAIIRLLKNRRNRPREASSRSRRDEGQSSRKRTKNATLNDFIKLLTPTLWSPAGRKALLLAVMLGLNTLLSDKSARLQGDIFKSVFTQRKSKFVGQLLKTFVYQFGTSVMNTTIDTTVKQLSLLWYNNLYNDVHNLYFKGLNHYKLAFVDNRITSPEEIICTDVPALTSGMAEVYRDVLRALFDGLFFTYRLAQETSPAWSSVTWTYVTLAVVSVRMMSPNFAKLFSKRNKLREVFTQAFGRVVTHSEAIAALNGDEREKSIVAGAFSSMQKHVRNIVRVQWSFGMIEDFVTKYAASTMAMIVILGPFFSGDLRSDFSVEGNATTMASMRYVTSVIINQLTAIAGLARCLRKVMSLNSYAKRVGMMRNVLKEISTQDANNESSIHDAEAIAFDSAKVITPNGHTLVEDLSFKVVSGKNLLITGPNGAGKSSIFRCLGALWSVAEGSISRPGGGCGQGLHDKVFYLPQKPYNVLGDLRDQIIYPITDEETKNLLTTETIRDLLSLVDLQYLMDTESDKEVNWEESLSLGETQRLAMARLFYHKPTFAILDECTSAVSHQMERNLYRLCAKQGITCITISHRPALMMFHDILLELDGDGGYKLEEIPKDRHHDGDGEEEEEEEEEQAKAMNALQRGNALSEVETPSFSPLVSPLKKSKSKLRRFLKLLKFLVPTLTGTSSKLLVSLSAVVIGRVWLSDRVAHMNGETVRLLLLDDLPGFKRLVGLSLMQCVASSVLAPSLTYLTRTLSLNWRDKLQYKLNDLLFRQKAFYKVSHVYGDISNMEQRVTADVEKVCQELANTFPLIVKPIADLAWFSSQSVMMIGAKKTALLYAYIFVGFGLLKIATPDFEKYVKESSNLQGVFRFIQRRVRTHGESIAFFGGQEKEGTIALKAFDNIVDHTSRRYKAEYVFQIVDNFVVKQLPSIVTWTLSLLYAQQVSPTANYQHDVHEGGRLGHELRYVASAVSHIFLASGQMLQLFKRFQEIAGYTHRVTELEDFLTALVDGADAEFENDCTISDRNTISLTDASIVTPTGRTLLYDVTLSIPRGEHLLITGPNTSGKSSLFRVLGGLWPLRKGEMTKPGGAHGATVQQIFLVPQRPYCPSGTLADQITYPDMADATDKELIASLDAIMETVNLSYLANDRQSWDAVNNWEDVLSLGEQQRLGMARLFFHKPLYAVLDQCTDAVSVEIEEQLYQQAEKLGITIITISQREALTSHHTQELKLHGVGSTYTLKTLKGTDSVSSTTTLLE